MKYIRTESGIYEVVKSNSRSTKFIYPTKNGIRFCYRQNNKCKFADTIEELVDFVAVKFKWEELPSIHSLKELYKKVEDKGQDKSIVFDNHKFLIERSRETHSVESIRYAIATNKGLMYVAKMNGKGELELL